MKWEYVAVLGAVLFLFAAYYVGNQSSTRDNGASPIARCISQCKAEIKGNISLANGPCLANPDSVNTDWVCDVAHSPRQLVDDDPANQCSAYRGGKAKHFVEVTPDCSFIRAK